MLHMQNLRSFKTQNPIKLSIIRLFFGISLAILDTIWAVYMKSFGLSDSSIGYLNAVLLLISIVFIFNCVNILEKFSEKKVFIFSSLSLILILVLFGINTSFILFLILAVLVTILNILRRNSFEILFKDNSPKDKLILNESILGVFTNIGWFTGPVIAGFLFVQYGFSIIFYLASGLTLISLLMFLRLNLVNKVNLTVKKKSFKFLFLNFFNNKKLRLPYLMSTGISMWWGFIFIYVPLFIYDSGIGNEYIGIFIGLSQLPLIFFEYFAGKNATKNGFKMSFFYGYLSLGIIAILAFIFASNIWIVMGLLILASIPMSFVEPLKFSFLFSKMGKSNEDQIIPIFTSSMAFGSLLAKISVASLLLIISNKYSYILMGIFMFLFSIIALKIKK